MEKRDIETPVNRTDAELLRAYVQSASEDAFKTIVERHQNMVFGTCRRLLMSAEAANDATQATFFVLARKAHGLSNHVTLAGWLYLTAKRTAFHVLRAKQRRDQHETEASALRNRVPQKPVDEMVRVELTRELDVALAALSASQRQVVILRYLEGRSQAEAAAELGVKEHSVSATLSRALQRMRDRLERRGVKVTSAVLLAFLLESTEAQLPDGLNATLNSLAGGAGDVSALALEVGQVMLHPVLSVKLLAVVFCMSIAMGGSWWAVPYIFNKEPVAVALPASVQPISNSTSNPIPAVPLKQQIDSPKPIQKKTLAEPGMVHSDRFNGEQLDLFWERVVPERMRTLRSAPNLNSRPSGLRLVMSGTVDEGEDDSLSLKTFEMISKPVPVGEGVLAIHLAGLAEIKVAGSFECGIELLNIDGRTICKIADQIEGPSPRALVVQMQDQSKTQSLPRASRTLGLILGRDGRLHFIPKYLREQKWTGVEIDQIRIRLYAKATNPKTRFTWLVQRLRVSRHKDLAEVGFKIKNGSSE